MKSNWIVYTKKADFKAIGERFGIDQVMARIIRNRGLETDEQINMYLNGTVDDMHSPHLLKDADKCVDILTDKIQAGKKIHIIGDYDIDGICSTTILYKGLKAAGADVTFAVPDRIIDGYGINEHLIDEAYNNGTDTIITCDNGIAAIEQIKYAKEKGMTVIVTDHHDIPFDFVDGEKIHKVPQADAIVNPKQEDCLYPFDKLCGAGVAFKVIKILYEKCGLNPAGLEEYAELMAIATIGDVVDLSDENRVIVKYGLKHLAVTTNIGIRALVEACELEIDKISSYLPDCHESVAGIIAGRVREKFYRPSIVITKAEDGAKGSGRSIEGYNMFEEISKCGKLLNKYGGHPMAAGISLDIDKIDEFRKALNENQTMTENVLTPTVWIDVPMPVDYVDIKLIKQFEKLQPFGKGNEKPVFADRNLTVRQSAVIGKNKNVLKCQLESEHGKLVTAIRFKLDGQEIPEVGKKISMVYYPDINEYNGIVSIQFRIEDWRYV